MQRPKLLPPPRWGDHGAVNRHLTAGGTVEGIVRDNPYREYYLQLTNNIMNFDLFSIELHRHAQSWIGLLGFNSRYHLFYIEWNYERKIENVEILWLFDWNRAR